jgi:hypothetical protein
LLPFENRRGKKRGGGAKRNEETHVRTYPCAWQFLGAHMHFNYFNYFINLL